MQVESDSLTPVNAICKGIDNQLEIGHIFDSCRDKLDFRTDLSLHLVRRQVNKVAHLMTRVFIHSIATIIFLCPLMFVCWRLLIMSVQ